MCTKLLILISILVTTAFGNIIYVDKFNRQHRNETGMSSLSWEESLNSIHDAIAVANGNDEIWITKGTYYTTQPSNSNRSISFLIKNKNHLKIYGGFDGSETSIDDRNNLTILSGNIGDTNVDTDNAFHILYIIDSNDVLLDGFIIQHGYANGDTDDNDVGGAIIIQYTDNLSIINSQFNNNYAKQHGGALEIVYSHNITIINTQFNHNDASQDAGALDAYISHNIFIKNTCFYNNYAGDDGGALRAYQSVDLNIENSQFTMNTAAGTTGGALYAFKSDNVVITNSIFNNNDVLDADGGALDYFQSQNAVILNVQINNNIANDDGGGLRAQRSNNMIISNCQFVNNSAGSLGGGLYIYYSYNTTITDTLFMDNYAVESGGGLCAFYSDNIIVNGCIFIGNSAVYRGGGLYPRGSNNIIIENTAFSRNLAIDGGSIFNDNGHYSTINNSTFLDNIAFGDGGAILNLNGNYLKINDCVFIGNSALNGGALMFDDETETQIEDVLFLENRATETTGAIVILNGFWNAFNINCTNNVAGLYGGCLMLYYSMHSCGQLQSTIYNSAFNDNSAKYGGALCLLSSCDSMWQNIVFNHNYAVISGGATFIISDSNTSMTTISDCEWNMNYANYEGGSLYIDSVNVNILNGVVHNNSAEFSGGGITIVSQMTMNYISTINILNTSIAYNSARVGGGIYILSTDNMNILVYNALIYRNAAELKGGAIYIHGAFMETLWCNIYENNADGGSGGALYHEYGIYVDFNSIFRDNSCRDKGGGLYIGDSNIKLNQSNFVANNASFGGGIFSTQCSGFDNYLYLSDNNAQYGGGAIYHAFTEYSCTSRNYQMLCNNESIICDETNSASYGAMTASLPNSIRVVLNQYSKSQVTVQY